MNYYMCMTCGATFDKSEAPSERYPGGETEYFCPNCGADDIEEVKDEIERSPD